MRDAGDISTEELRHKVNKHSAAMFCSVAFLLFRQNDCLINLIRDTNNNEYNVKKYIGNYQ